MRSMIQECQWNVAVDRLGLQMPNRRILIRPRSPLQFGVPFVPVIGLFVGVRQPKYSRLVERRTKKDNAQR